MCSGDVRRGQLYREERGPAPQGPRQAPGRVLEPPCRRALPGRRLPGGAPQQGPPAPLPERAVQEAGMYSTGGMLFGCAVSAAVIFSRPVGSLRVSSAEVPMPPCRGGRGRGDKGREEG